MGAAAIKSKLIADYIEVRLEDFRAGVALPTDVYLYFAINRHLLVWRKGGEVLDAVALKRYQARGMGRVWIHREDYGRWGAYFAPADSVVAIAADAPAAEAWTTVPGDAQEPALEAEKPPEPRTEEGREIIDLLRSEAMPEKSRAALVARAARELLNETVHPQPPATQKDAVVHARAAMRDVVEAALANANANMRKLVGQVWDVSSMDPDLDHAVNVASLSLLFAMAFGRISQDLLADIALAGLLHDIGLTQIPVQAAQVPWKEQTGRVAQLYGRHVDEGLRLLEEVAPTLPQRARPLIQQHHEKFDGSGYPLQLQGFQVNDVAQLVAMADAVESMASGQWDGQKRTLLETFECLEKLETSRTFPEYFNPEVFASVIRWVRNPGSISSSLSATEIVKTTTRDLLKRRSP